MIRLMLARHGETAWNAQHRFQGHTDVPLNETGRGQATALARRLAGEEIDAIYASPLSRALETAQIVARHHPDQLTVQEDDRLREMSFGDWEGLTHAEIQASYAQELTAWRDDPAVTSPPNGETVAQLLDRVEGFQTDLRREHRDRTVLVVAHGGLLRVLLCYTLELDHQLQWRFRIDAASLSEVHIYDTTAVLSLLNDTSHQFVEPMRTGPPA